MPMSLAAASELLRRLAPHVEDDAVIAYLAEAVLEATSREEVRDCCEVWLGEQVDFGVQAICEALGISGSQAQANSKEDSLVGKAAQLSGGYPKLLAVPLAAVGLGTDKGGSDGSDDDDKGTTDAKFKTLGKATGSKAKKKVREKEAEPSESARQSQSLAPAAELVEVTARVSRFHREAVEDEISSAVAEVDVHGLCISVAGRELLKDAHLKLCPGQRYGFVGRNGTGKSTLFRAMAARQIPGYPPNFVTLLVDQEDVGDEQDAVDTVLSSSKELCDLLAEECVLLPCEAGSLEGAVTALRSHELLLAREARRKAAMYESKLSGVRGKSAREALLEAEARERLAEETLANEIIADGQDTQQIQANMLLADVREQLRTIGAEAMRGQAEVTLKGLGFSAEALKQPTRLLSGGWRMRVALAKALLAKPDVLLLDEPTNHLDWSAILWLERYLQSDDLSRVALVVVSHDREFLDKVGTMTLRLFEKQLQLHAGNYSTFEEAHALDQKHREELAHRIHDKQSKVEKQIQEMEQKGRKSNNDNLLKAATSRRTKLGLDDKPWSFNRVGLERVGGHKFKASYGTHEVAMAGSAVETKEAQVKLRLRAAAPLGFDAALLQCRDLVVGFDSSSPLLRKFDLDVRAKSRIGILGVNGSGKTTLLRTLVGDLLALGGEVYQQPRALVGFFNQHQTDGLPSAATALEALCESNPACTEVEVRAHLGSFGLGRLAVQPIRCLSGGERSRVALARATLRPPHVLILDEPTNHLDLQTVETLAKQLKEFEGSIVITSHDRRLLRDVCTDFYAVQGQQLVRLSLDTFVRSVR